MPTVTDAGYSECKELFLSALNSFDGKFVADLQIGAQRYIPVDERFFIPSTGQLPALVGRRFARLARLHPDQRDVQGFWACTLDQRRVAKAQRADGLDAFYPLHIVEFAVVESAGGDRQVNPGLIQNEIGIQLLDVFAVAQPQSFGQTGDEQDQRSDKRHNQADQQVSALIPPQLFPGQLQK